MWRCRSFSFPLRPFWAPVGSLYFLFLSDIFLILQCFRMQWLFLWLNRAFRNSFTAKKEKEKKETLTRSTRWYQRLSFWNWNSNDCIPGFIDLPFPRRDGVSIPGLGNNDDKPLGESRGPLLPWHIREAVSRYFDNGFSPFAVRRKNVDHARKGRVLLCVWLNSRHLLLSLTSTRFKSRKLPRQSSLRYLLSC